MSREVLNPNLRCVNGLKNNDGCFLCIWSPAPQEVEDDLIAGLIQDFVSDTRPQYRAGQELLSALDKHSKRAYAQDHFNTVVLVYSDLTVYKSREDRLAYDRYLSALVYNLTNVYPEAGIRVIERYLSDDPTDLKKEVWITVGKHSLYDLEKSVILRNIAQKKGYDAYIMTISESDLGEAIMFLDESDIDTTNFTEKTESSGSGWPGMNEN